MGSLASRLLATAVFAAPLAPSAPPAPDYELLFADEFDGKPANTGAHGCTV
jgi:hypothetical protein